MQLIDSSERVDTLLSNVPQWDSNQLPTDYKPDVQIITLSPYVKMSPKTANSLIIQYISFQNYLSTVAPSVSMIDFQGGRGINFTN